MSKVNVLSGTDPIHQVEHHYMESFIFQVRPPAHRVKVSVTEILVRMSWFVGACEVWHMWVNAGKSG
jgi:hypothetical protein